MVLSPEKLQALVRLRSSLEELLGSARATAHHLSHQFDAIGKHVGAVFTEIRLVLEGESVAAEFDRLRRRGG